MNLDKILKWLLLPWSSFNSLGRSRIVQSSYLWALLVPILAKMLSAIEQEFLELAIFSSNLRIVLNVPFTWELLYYSSVSFALATLVYTITCPEIVKNYDNYSDFKAEGKGSDQLINYAFGILGGHHRRIIYYWLATCPNLQQFCACYVRQWARRQNDKNNLDRFVVTLGEQQAANPDFEPNILGWYVPEERESAAFWFIRDHADCYSPLPRAIVEVLYGIGFVLFAWVMAQNFWFVFSHAS